VEKNALMLEPSPCSVQEARRWVGDACAQLGRTDLVESAEVGVSELVTNALLHAGPPLSVRVGGTREHPRVEVYDASCQPPAVPARGGVGLPTVLLELDGLDLADLTEADDPDLGDSAFLSTFGRGLGIVSMVSAAWGADVVDDGKVVWFEPAPADDDAQPADALVFTLSEESMPHPDHEEPLTSVLLCGVPVRTYAGFRHHFRELRRELRLLSLAHEAEYPLATNLSRLLTDFEQHLRHGIGTERIDRALAAGLDTVELPVRMPASATAVVTQVLDMLELADAFCRTERLLSLARTPLQQRFQRWFLGEFVRQGEGLPPTPWARVRPAADQTGR
jgi:hypothetical protein